MTGGASPIPPLHQHAIISHIADTANRIADIAYHLDKMAQADDAKRATTAITIAQLKFKQGVKKEDVDARLPPTPVESCSQFFRALDAVLAQNTPVNIQVSDCNTTIDCWS